MKIVYKNPDPEASLDAIIVLHPTPEALAFASIEEIALKDVPADIEYTILQDDEIDTSRVLRLAWVWHPDWTPVGKGAKSNKFSKKVLAKMRKVKNENKS